LSKAPTIRLGRLGMTRFLLGPMKPSLLLDLPREQLWLDRVFPLPFYLPSLWRV